jgi:putative spermidine/putrescine transport system substrate-binding protein
MKGPMMNRREVLAALAAGGSAALLPRSALAAGAVTGAIYPGAWEDAYREIVAPALLETHKIRLDMQPLFAVEQIAKARAARGFAPFDVFVLDPGPRATGVEGRMFEKFDASKLKNAGKLPPGAIDEHGVSVGAQFVGIGYNPKKFSEPPKSWLDLFREPYVSRLGLTGFQTTFGTVAIIEIAKALGGTDSDVEPFFTEVRKALPKVASVSSPVAALSLFQQGQIDIFYTNTQNVGTLKARGVDIEFVKPEKGAPAFFTTMHIAKNASDVDNAYKYIDTVLDAKVQAALMAPPYFLAPVNREVPLASANLPLASLDELQNFTSHDWSKINPLRAGWIERFNREVAK